MPAFHDQLLEAVVAERRRMTRRMLLSRTVTVAGGAVAVAAFGRAGIAFAQDATPDAMMGNSTMGTPETMSGGSMMGTPAAGGMMMSPFKDDLDVLNYALTLEHLEHAFYRDGVGKFTFGKDTFGLSIDDNLAAIRDHEAAHVKALTDVITSMNGTPVAEATYAFGTAYTDPKAFLATAVALEATGVKAYDGAAQYIGNADLLTAAGSIVAVEARHSSYLNQITGGMPFPGPFETTLPPDEVLKIAGSFIVK